MKPAEYDIMYRVERDHWWYRGLRGVLRMYVPAGDPSRRLLDVGCGTGATLDHFAPDATGFGVDVMPAAVAYCRARALLRTAVGSATELPWGDEVCDVVISADVLCHGAIADDRVAVREMARVLRPGGVVVLSLPAYQWLWSSHDMNVQTKRRYTARRVRRLVKEAGLEPVRWTYWNTLLFPLVAAVRLWGRLRPREESDLTFEAGRLGSRVLGGVLALERLLMRVAPLPFGVSVLVVARKPG
jgi:SAM-dependent methyltransferase